MPQPSGTPNVVAGRSSVYTGVLYQAVMTCQRRSVAAIVRLELVLLLVYSWIDPPCSICCTGRLAHGSQAIPGSCITKGLSLHRHACTYV